MPLSKTGGGGRCCLALALLDFGNHGLTIYQNGTSSSYAETKTGIGHENGILGVRNMKESWVEVIERNCGHVPSKPPLTDRALAAVRTRTWTRTGDHVPRFPGLPPCERGLEDSVIAAQKGNGTFYGPERTQLTEDDGKVKSDSAAKWEQGERDRRASIATWLTHGFSMVHAWDGSPWGGFWVDEDADDADVPDEVSREGAVPELVSASDPEDSA
ncbi:hypothetical protein FB107DRAFT_249361 [Schizophyllum commune]